MFTEPENSLNHGFMSAMVFVCRTHTGISASEYSLFV